ncbi:LysR family transcriptional regulator [Peribacillus sp. NPDC046944]|uniref:LysR family transcriptional regulator n=1 Tax=unclassified Peribacillus TaxID=2675266 RepID=UPI0038066ADD
MDIRQLRYFLALSEEGQVSRAAKRLNMSQPPLSQQLNLMEEELGVTLLDRKRNGKRMELTEAGRALYEKSKVLLELFDDSMLEVKETGEGIQGTLAIGAVLAYMSYLPSKVKQFNDKYPSVTFKLFAGDPYEINNYMENQDIELAIVYLPVDSNQVFIKNIGEVPNVFVVPEEWEDFHFKDKISLNDLENTPLLLVHREKGLGIYEEIIEEFKKNELKPNILCECHDVNVLLSLVSAGIGASIVPKSAVSPHGIKGVRVLEIIDSAIQSKIALIWRKDRYLSKTAKHFIDLF